MKILIADDEPLARERLAALVTEMQLGEVVGEAANGEEVLQKTTLLEPDIILLDIRMPGMNGLETAIHLDRLEQPPAVIFTTAYDEYALQAFEAHAVDYLLKPVRRERLAGAIQSVSRLTRAQVEGLQSASGVNSPTHISARVKGGLKLIPVDEIVYFLAEHKYVSIFTKDAEVLIDDPLKKLEEQFADQFVRIHRNALVALHEITSLYKDGGGQFQVRLRSMDKTLEVSRRHVAAVRKRLTI
ncbi:MAG: LytTR family DNA-binding domain-containing protein [Gammaproteobacteria bacterium]|nr:LytTR family DNA-binding domain-containing protein [Gammaproteobacteria bacterium]MDH5650339.1 LytTR family DNA-binding domain-containing protein [Gammaproteobacteria bacterium]